MRRDEEIIAILFKKSLLSAQQEEEVGKRVFYRLLLARTESPVTPLPDEDENGQGCKCHHAHAHWILLFHFRLEGRCVREIRRTMTRRGGFDVVPGIHGHRLRVARNLGRIKAFDVTETNTISILQHTFAKCLVVHARAIGRIKIF